MPDAPDKIDLGSHGTVHVRGDLSDGTSPVFFPPMEYVGMDGGSPRRPIYEAEGGAAQLVYGTIITGWRLWNDTPEAEWQSPGSVALSPFDVSENEWTNADLETGAPRLSHAPAPASLALDSDAAAVAATLTTNLTGTHNDLTFTRAPAGRLGNDITVRYVKPGTPNASLAGGVSCRDITVNLATNGSAAITSTATQVRTALAANAAAAALVSVAHSAGNDGNGVVTAMGATALAGGAGGLPLPPGTLSL